MSFLKIQSSGIKPDSSQLMLFTAFLLFLYFIFSMSSLYLASYIWKIDMGSMQQHFNADDKDFISALKFIQLFSSIGTFIIPPFLFLRWSGESATGFMMMDKRVDAKTCLAGLIIMLSFTPLINLIADMNAKIRLPESMHALEESLKNSEAFAAKITNAFLKMDTIGDLLLNSIIIAVIPAIGEEFVFRGMYQKYFISLTKNVHAGIVIAAVLFSLMHMQFYGFIPRALLGIYLGYLMYWSKSIWLPVFAHFVNNISAVIMSYLLSKNMLNFDPDKLGTNPENSLQLILASCIITISLSYYIYKRTAK